MMRRKAHMSKGLLVAVLLLFGCSGGEVAPTPPARSTPRPAVLPATPYVSPTPTVYVPPTPVPAPRYIGVEYGETIKLFEDLGYRFSRNMAGGVTGVLARVPMDGEWYRVVIQGDFRGIEETSLLFYSYGILPDPSLVVFLDFMTDFQLDLDRWFSTWRNKLEGRFTLYTGDVRVTTVLNDLETAIVIESRTR